MDVSSGTATGCEEMKIYTVGWYVGLVWSGLRRQVRSRQFAPGFKVHSFHKILIQLFGQVFAHLGEHAGPIAGLLLSKKAHRRIPGAVAAVLQPAPVGDC